MIENHIKTVLLLGILTGILLWIGSFWGADGLTVAIIFVVLMNLVTYFFSDRIVLFMYRAQPVKEKDESHLCKIVREVAAKAAVPMPKVYIIPSDSSNAFATGRNPKNAVVACTKGITRLLSEHELKGVIAHEISHIKNRDILIATIAATIAGIISFAAMMARWGAMMQSRDRNGGRGIELLVLGILTPIIATIIQLAISRSREYLADERAARTLHDSSGLSSALKKLEAEARHHPMMFGSRTSASLFIVNPFRGEALLSLFSTHPPIGRRVERLNRMKF